MGDRARELSLRREFFPPLYVDGIVEISDSYKLWRYGVGETIKNSCRMNGATGEKRVASSVRLVLKNSS